MNQLAAENEHNFEHLIQEMTKKLKDFRQHGKVEMINSDQQRIETHLSTMLAQDHQQCDIERSKCTSAVDEDFECVICKYIVQNPVECRKCDKLYCKNCMQTWEQRKKECPHCRSSEEMKKPSRIIQKQIAKIKVKCSDCHASFTIGDTKKHAENCNRKVRVLCIACGMVTIKAPISQIKEKLKQHLTTECARRTGFQCFHCNKILSRNQRLNHQCFKDFEARMAEEIKQLTLMMWEKVESTGLKFGFTQERKQFPFLNVESDADYGEEEDEEFY